MKKIILSLFFITAFSIYGYAAVGCDLNDPDRDVKRFFPQSASYKTGYFSIAKLGGENLLKEVENKLGDNFTGLYETIDVPYTLYTIYKDGKIIGYIHGINQKGKYGGLQVFLIYNSDLKIENFYYQKLTSKKAKEMRSKEFSSQFAGLTIEDFKNYNPKSHSGGSQKVKNIKNPVSDNDTDFYATLRAVKKNLILADLFLKSSATK
jgi:hypothetical protein